MTGFKLAEHQLYCLDLMESNDALGLFCEMGTGKTATALAWVARALRRGEIKDALVICPASLTGNWADAIEKMRLFEGFDESDIVRMRKAIHISSYQKLYRITRKDVKHKNGKISRKRIINLRPEVDRHWGAIIVDEAHAIGAHDSVQTKVCHTLARLTTHRYILTATPVLGGGRGAAYEKLYGEIRFLDPDKWDTWTQFCRTYVRAYDRWDKPVEFDESACKGLLMDHGVAIRLEDCFDMPGTIDIEIPCKLEEKAVYDDVAGGRGGKYGLDILTGGTVNTKLLQICSGSMKLDEERTLTFKCSKDSALREVLGGTSDKVVIFCQYRASVDRCAEICRKAGRKTVVFDGRSKGETWREFQYGDADALVCQFASGGAGLDLFASSHMVIFEPCRSALLYKQATGRIYRKGQERKCVYTYLHTPGLETKALTSIRKGVDVTDEMLDRWAHGLDF